MVSVVRQLKLRLAATDHDIPPRITSLEDLRKHPKLASYGNANNTNATVAFAQIGVHAPGN